MDSKERYLYHQIHPVKLGTDWGFGLVALAYLWRHNWPAALVVGVVPSAVASAVIIRRVDLTRLRASRFGRYVAKHMTRPMEAIRFAGFALAGLGAWFHLAWLVGAGVLVIAYGWVRGLLRN